MAAIERRPDKIKFAGKVLYLTEDPEQLKAQLKLNNIGAALFQAYIFQPFQNPDEQHMVQQEEQQQQIRPVIAI